MTLKPAEILLFFRKEWRINIIFVIILVLITYEKKMYNDIKFCILIPEKYKYNMLRFTRLIFPSFIS